MSFHLGKTTSVFVFLALRLYEIRIFIFNCNYMDLMNISLLNKEALMTFLRERLVTLNNVFNLFLSVLFFPLLSAITKYVV